MRNTLYFLVIPVSVLLASCGTSRRAARTTPPELQVTDQGIPTVILYPRGYEPRDIDAIPAYAETVAEAYADLSFAGLETEHVRVRGVNPLPSSGLLEVDLDQLRDKFVYPYRGNFISDYGMRNGRPHTGVDIKAIPDDTIRAVLPGVVRMSKEYSSYGNLVVVQHYCGFETVYAHCSRNLVRVNQRVEAGTPIGLAGRTGRATTEHLHFEVRVAGQPIDPKLLLDVDNHCLKGGRLYAQDNDGELVAYNDLSQFGARAGTAGDGPRGNIPRNINPAPLQEVIALEPNDLPPTEVTGATAPAAAYHTVSQGDTLYGIARKYSTTVKELCRINGIAENGILSLGQKIRYR